jgi:bifunctional isochorismate lyase / aryl carrier protein
MNSVSHASAEQLPTSWAKSTNKLVKRRIQPYAIPTTECLDFNKVEWPVNPLETALIVHDMQNYWCDFFVDSTLLVNNVTSLVHAAREAGIPIIYTKAEVPQHVTARGLGLQMWGPGLAAPGVTATDPEIIDCIAPRSNDYLIEKIRYSGFFETDLEKILGRINRRHVAICGVFAHHGVMLTCADAYMRNIKASLIIDAVADYTVEDHMFTAKYVSEVCGVITKTGDVIAQLKQ